MNSEKTDLNGETIKVLLLDTGIDLSHPIFDGHFIKTKDFCFSGHAGNEDLDGHGTQCAGSIVQLAPTCNLLSGRIMTHSGLFTYGALLDGLEWAIEEKVDVICICSGERYGDTEVEELLNKLACDHHIVVVAAIGNYGEHDNRGHYPALYDSVVAVGATDNQGELMDFTELPANLDLICLPGLDYRGPWLEGGYVTNSGTSISAARLSSYLGIWLANQKKQNQVYNFSGIKKMLTGASIQKKSPRGHYLFFDSAKFLTEVKSR